MTIVIPVRNGGPGEPETLRYALRSIARNLPHETPVLFGYRPDWYLGEHRPTVQDKDKHGNIGINLLAAAAEFPTFTFWSDDCYVMKPAVPAVHAREESVDHLFDRCPTMPWKVTFGAQRDMLRQWGYDTNTLPCSDSHHPMLINSERLVELVERVKATNPKHPLGAFKALYGAGCDVEVSEDPKVMNPRRSINPDATYVSTCGATFFHGQAGVEIRAAFPEPCQYER